MTDFSDQFRKIIMRYKRIGYNLNVMRQSACLVINAITVDGSAALFNCTHVALMETSPFHKFTGKYRSTGELTRISSKIDSTRQSSPA